MANLNDLLEHHVGDARPDMFSILVQAARAPDMSRSSLDELSRRLKCGTLNQVQKLMLLASME